MRLFGIDCEDYYVVLWSWRAVAVGLVILCDAFLAYFLKDRKLFWIGIAGTILGALIPQPRNYPLYRSVEGAVVGKIHESFDHVFTMAFFGLVAASSLYWYWRHRSSQKTKQLDQQNSDANNHENAPA